MKRYRKKHLPQISQIKNKPAQTFNCLENKISKNSSLQ